MGCQFQAAARPALSSAVKRAGTPMSNAWRRTVCWIPTWNNDRKGVGLEHLLLSERLADSVIVAFDEEHGPFRLTYRLAWDESWRIRNAELVVVTERSTRSLSLRTDGQGHWRRGDGPTIDDLNGCVDIDIWPTPFTNSFPILREPMTVGERREFKMAWIRAPDLAVHSTTAGLYAAGRASLPLREPRRKRLQGRTSRG